MTTSEKILKLEELLDVEETALTETTELAGLDEWDSVSRLSLLIYFEEELGRTLSDEEIKGFKTVKDILELMD